MLVLQVLSETVRISERFTRTQMRKMKKIKRTPPQAMMAMAQFGSTGLSSSGTATAAQIFILHINDNFI